MPSRASKIRDYILATVAKHANDIIAVTASKFVVSRTTVHRHIHSLIKEGKIIKSGSTKDTLYFLSDSLSRKLTYQLASNLDEAKIFAEDFESTIQFFHENIKDIISYTFTEIANNAIDHSRGKKLTITTSLKKDLLILSIEDDGIGVFKNIYDYFHLDDIRESILQISKGKTTTDPAHHTGEGIFFSSQLSYLFEIYANGLHFLRDNNAQDWTLTEDKSLKKGSLVVMTYDLNSPINIIKTLEKFQDEDDLSFSRTEIIVELSKFKEETFISRSQAKRVLRNLQAFQKITLDFKKVRLIGQGFVDEIFRMYQNQRPTVEIDYINANSDVTFMIERQKAR